MQNIQNVITRRLNFHRFKSVFSNKLQTRNIRRNAANYNLQYLLILDFEATCDEPKLPKRQVSF